MNTQQEVSYQASLEQMGRAAVAGVFDGSTNPFKVKPGREKREVREKCKSDVGLRRSMAGRGTRWWETQDRERVISCHEGRSGRGDAAKRLSLTRFFLTRPKKNGSDEP
jgi:hypothetical protein